MEDLQNPSGIIYVVALFFTVGIFLFVGFIAFNVINEAFLEVDVLDNHDVARETVEGVFGLGHMIDYMFLFFIVSFLIAMPIAAYFAPTHPAMVVGFIFLFIIALTMSVVFSDAFEMIGEKEQVVEYYDNMPIVKNLMYFMPLIVIINAVVCGVVMYGKTRAGAGEY